jgi:tryptophan synthase alpha chain
VGFGIRTPEQAARIAPLADGVVVGSAIVSIVADNLKEPRGVLIGKVADLVGRLASSTHQAPRARA